MKNLLTTFKQMLLYPFNFISSRMMSPKQTFDNITNGEGAVVDDNGKKVAVYKDENGNVTEMSPVCTHLKCIIAWDAKEKVWICPCHQSHFSPVGKVLKGPAKKDLKKIS